ncbi:MAG: hypothetical protein WA869_30035 [Alloacidobacterium sp.]
MAIGHRPAIEFDPSALGVNVLQRDQSTGRRIGGDGVQGADGLGVPRGLRGIHRKGPPAAFALRHVGHLPDADIGVQAARVTLGQLQAQEAAPGMAGDEDFLVP